MLLKSVNFHCKNHSIPIPFQVKLAHPMLIGIDRCRAFWKTPANALSNLVGPKMKTNLSIVIVFVTATLLASVGNSQDLGIFSGRGIGTSGSLEMPNVVEETKSRWPPKILDFSRDTSTQTARKPFSALFKKPSFEMPKLGLPKLGLPKFERPSLDIFKPRFGADGSNNGIVNAPPSLADLFPKRDPNRPSLFAKMNEKSKSFFDRTTGWVAGKNQNLKSKSSSTWDSVMSDYREIQSQGNGVTPARPNVRTAEATGQPRVRF